MRSHVPVVHARFSDGGVGMMTTVHDSHLHALRRDLAEAVADAERLVADLSEAQLNWSPALGVWSIAQCLDHLAITVEQYRTALEAAVERGRERAAAAGAAPYRPTSRRGASPPPSASVRRRGRRRAPRTASSPSTGR
jgi:hypothetical protein